MIYILAALLPPLGLLLNGQPFSAVLNVVLIVFCVLLGLLFSLCMGAVGGFLPSFWAMRLKALDSLR